MSAPAHTPAAVVPLFARSAGGPAPVGHLVAPGEPRFSTVADLRRGLAAGYVVRTLPAGDGAPAPVAEAAGLEAALAARDALPPDTFLLVELSAAAACHPHVREVLLAAAPLGGVVLALGGGAGGAEDHDLRAALAPAREAGALLALDAGDGRAGPARVLALRPAFVRLGPEVVAEVDRDEGRAAAVEALGGLASRIDAWLLAAGATRREELDALARLGVPLAAGPLLGEGLDAPAEVPEAIAEDLRAGAALRAAGGPLLPLVERPPALPAASPTSVLAEAFLADPAHEVLPLLDDERRPVGLADRAAYLDGRPYRRPVLRIGPRASPRAAGRRAMARPRDERFDPLVVCDVRGRYVGVVRVERLVDLLPG